MLSFKAVFMWVSGKGRVIQKLENAVRCATKYNIWNIEEFHQITAQTPNKTVGNKSEDSAAWNKEKRKKVFPNKQYFVMQYPI